MTITVLAAGDHFVLPELLTAAVRRRCGDQVALTELTLPWPDVPFDSVGEVTEASGTEDLLIEHLEGAQACLTQMAPLTERVLAACPDLRFFGVGRGGPVNANVEAATRHGVMVTRAPGRNAVATAEHTIALLLAAARRVTTSHADLAEGTWRGDYYRYDSVGPEIAGAVVGLVGLGEIGGRVAERLESFGATVIVHDPYLPEDHPRADSLVDLDELFSRSGFVSLHARLTAENHHLVGKDQIAMMAPGSVLVNAARGGLLDYDALCDALESGHLFGAAVDVFPEEPIPADSRLLHTPHLVMTPHLAGASKQTAGNAAEITASDLARFLDGHAPRNALNPEVLAEP